MATPKYLPFYGMRGTGDWQDGIRPQNWREMILYLYPNGTVPITAMASMLSSEKTDDPRFNWFEKSLPEQQGPLLGDGIYTDPSLGTAFTTGGAAMSIYFARISQELAQEFRRGHQVLLEKEGDPRFETQAEVLTVMLNGDNSYVSIQLHEDPAEETTLAGVDTISVIGNLNAEGATMPDAISYDPTNLWNYTQIWRTSLSITRTARLTKIRYGSDAYQLAKSEALELHALEMEKSTIWGERLERIGDNGKPKRTTRGIIKAIKAAAPENVVDYRYDPDYAGLTWAEGGEEWLNANLTRLFTYGRDEKMAYVGYGASAGIGALAKAGSEFQISSSVRRYGIRVNEWLLSNGVLHLKTHPLFAKRANYRNAMLIHEPQRMRFRAISDTDFITDPPDKVNRNNSKDATEEEYLTEGGFEYHNAETGGVLYGVGENNLLPTPP